MKYQTIGKCIACLFEGQIDLHHIKSRKANGSDSEHNLMPLCRSCHQEVHRIGRTTFITRYNLDKWMQDRGWEFEEFNERWWYCDKKGWDDE